MSAIEVKELLKRNHFPGHFKNSFTFLIMAITIALVWLLINYYCKVRTGTDKAVLLQPQKSAYVERITHTD